jgi:hypothetical protein
MSGGAETPFYRPHRESARWSVRDPEMSDPRVEHIRKRLLEPGMDTGQVRCTRISTVKICWAEHVRLQDRIYPENVSGT